MLSNFFKIALRNILGNLVISFINIFGMVLGMTSAMIILLLVFHEISYDRFHKDAGNIYRIATNFKMGSALYNLSICPTPLGPALQSEYPNIESYTRINKARTSALFSYGEKKIYEEEFFYADSGFFKTFSFELISGNPQEVLKLPYSLVLTEETAGKYFGEVDPIGSTMMINNKTAYTVTGVVKNPPENSHFKFSIIGSFSTLYEERGKKTMDMWAGNLNYWTYVRVLSGTNSENLSLMASDLIQLNAGDKLKETGAQINPVIQRITDINLHSNMMGEIEPNTGIGYVRIFLSIAIFILVIASINFMNLLTARSASRAREVGIKKTVGASKISLIQQFIRESILQCFLALLISLILIEFALPFFNTLMGKNLDFNYSKNFPILLSFIGIAIVTGFLSGIYPAFYLSSFKPIKILKGELTTGKKHTVFRNFLVVIQFTLAVILMAGSILISRQLNYMRNRNLGFNKDQILIIPLRGNDLRSKYQTIKNEIKKLPFVVNVTASQNYPGKMFSRNSYKFEDSASEEAIAMASIDIDEDFIPAYDMKIMRGRNFSLDFPTDEKAVIINETVLKLTGLEKPLGKEVTLNNMPGFKVIGVAKDFHYASLHEQIDPLVISKRENRFQYLNIKILKTDMDQSLRLLSDAWEKIDPGSPFDYFFLDETFEKLYENEDRISGIFRLFTFLAIIIALLGLFGLTSYIIEQRTKEIGIRKAMGSSSSGVTMMLSGNFLRLVLIANILAIPVAYLIIEKWLRDFAFKTHISVWDFILAAFVSIFVAFLTIIYQSVRAAKKNPADSLRHE